MSYFHYIARRENGLPVKGWLVSASRDDALITLRKRALNPLVVRPGPGRIPLRVPRQELLSSIRELAGLRTGGMVLDKAVQAVAEVAEHHALGRAWGQVGEMLKSGLSLSDAMASVPDAFPPYVVPMVRLGEASGKLADALMNLAQRLEEETELQSEIKTAMTYPGFLLFIAMAVFFFLFLVVIPKFGGMVQGVSSAGSGGLDVLLNVSAWLRDYVWLWSGCVATLLALGLKGWKTGTLQSWLWPWMWRMPGIGGIMSAWEITQLAGSMARLLGGGVPLLEGLRLSTDMVARDALRHALEEASMQVRRGKTLAAALESQQVFPPLVLRMIAVGETAASLPSSMEQIAKIYRRRMRTGIRRGLSLLEPAVIIFMGLFIGSIMITLLSAIISVNDIPL